MVVACSKNGKSPRKCCDQLLTVDVHGARRVNPPESVSVLAFDMALVSFKLLEMTAIFPPLTRASVYCAANNHPERYHSHHHRQRSRVTRVTDCFDATTHLLLASCSPASRWLQQQQQLHQHRAIVGKKDALTNFGTEPHPNRRTPACSASSSIVL